MSHDQVYGISGRDHRRRTGSVSAAASGARPRARKRIIAA